MKKLIIVNGTMGAGKSATCEELVKLVQPGVYLDGDWCWEPSIVNENTKAMVIDNIIHMLSNYLSCDDYENIIFCWVLHKQSIVDEILNGLSDYEFELVKFTLTITEEALTERITDDIQRGLREQEDLQKSLSRIRNYDKMETRKVDVSNINVKQAANCIANEIKKD